MSARTLFLHVGSSKTGTSTLQASLWRSTDALADAGIGVPYPGRGAHVKRVVGPLGWAPSRGYDPDADPSEAMARLTRRLRKTPGDRLVMSNEDLADAPPSAIKAFGEAVAAADLDLHLIVTARDWTRQLPSEWQQFLKERLTQPYPEFLDAVRRREGHFAERFWLRQDLLGISRRWGAGLDPTRVHLIPVPPASVDADLVFRSFGEVVGCDPAVLDRSGAGDINQSYGFVEAEVLRRLNAQLGDRLADYAGEYRRAVRGTLARKVLARKASARIPLPPEQLGWVREVAEGHVAGLRTDGYAVHGDLETLVPGPEDCAPLPPVGDAEIAEAAIETLINFSIRRLREIDAAGKGGTA